MDPFSPQISMQQGQHLSHLRCMCKSTHVAKHCNTHTPFLQQDAAAQPQPTKHRGQLVFTSPAGSQDPTRGSISHIPPTGEALLRKGTCPTVPPSPALQAPVIYWSSSREGGTSSFCRQQPQPWECEQRHHRLMRSGQPPANTASDYGCSAPLPTLQQSHAD